MYVNYKYNNIKATVAEKHKGSKNKIKETENFKPRTAIIPMNQVQQIIMKRLNNNKTKVGQEREVNIYKAEASPVNAIISGGSGNSMRRLSNG